jgi:hypothetical protein
MPRQVRIEYPGAIYHVMSRGNRRQDIYLDDVDRQDFLKTLAEAEELRRVGWTGGDLAAQRKRHPCKLGIALRLRKETTLSIKEIAARLHLGTPGSASVCLLACMEQLPAAAPAQAVLGI